MLSFFVALGLLLLLRYCKRNTDLSETETTALKTVDKDRHQHKVRQEQGTVIYQVNVNRVKNVHVGALAKIHEKSPPEHTGGIEIEWGNSEGAGRTLSVSSERLNDQLQKEKTMNEELLDVIRKLSLRLEAMDKWEQKEKDDREQISSMITSLQDQLRRGEEKTKFMEQQFQNRTESLSVKYKKELREEHDKVSAFVFQLERRDKQLSDNVISKMEDAKLRDVAIHLVEKYNVRLLAVDCGLNFVLDVPQCRQSVVDECREEIGELLKTLLPDEIRSKVKMRKRFSAGSLPHPPKQAEDQKTTRVLSGRKRVNFSTTDDVFYPELPLDTQSLKHQPKGLEEKGANGVHEERMAFPENSGALDRPRPTCSFSARKERDISLNSKELSDQKDTRSTDKMQIEYLKSRIRQLEQELESHTKGADGSLPIRRRSDEDRMITTSLQFRMKRDTKLSVFEPLTQPSQFQLDDIAKRLKPFNVSLQGVFYSYSNTNDNSLAFQLQTSVAQLIPLKDCQGEIQNILSELLEDKDVIWSDMTTGRNPVSPRKDC